MEENEVYEEGLTFKELFSYIWSKKILGLIIAVITLVVSFAGLFLYSKSDASYVSSFKLNWSGIGSEQYPDGSTFKYQDIISKDNIEYVIEENESLSYLTSEKLLKKDNLDIQYVISYVDEDNKELGTKSHYVLTSGAKVFKNEKDARLFFEELITHQYEIASKKINNFRFNNALDSIIPSTEYNVIFNLIGTQIGLISGYVDGAIQGHGSDFAYDGEKTINDLKNSIRDFNNQYYNSNINYAYILNNYVRNIDTALSKFNIEKANILKQIDRKEQYLDRLAEEAKNIAGAITSDAYINKVGPVLEEIIELQYRLEYLESTSLKFNEDYNNQVNRYIDGMNTLTEEANKLKKAIGEDALDLTFASNEIVEYKSFGTMKAALLSVVIAIVLPFIVLLIMCLVKRPGSDKKALETVPAIENVEEVKTETTEKESK